jgi:hypothetical protein
VKQRCVSKQFIAINDDPEMVARVFISNGREGGREQDSGDTERECVCFRGRALQRERERERERERDGCRQQNRP